MALPPFPRRYSDIHAWWECARRASADQLAPFIASDDFDQLTSKGQTKLIKIYEQAKLKRKKLRRFDCFVCVLASATFLAVVLIVRAANAYPTATIKRCYDGDTCTTTTGEKIRLACIDTPELKGKKADPEPAQAARDYLRRMVVGKEVGIRRITKDRYGRTVAELYLNGSNVQQQLVASGHAEIFWKYARQCPWTR